MPIQTKFGPIAQLGERHNGIVEVSGSIPLGSTKMKTPARSDRAGVFILECGDFHPSAAAALGTPVDAAL